MLRTALNYPIIIGLACFFVLWVAARLGDRITWPGFAPKELEEFNLVLGATLTLLGLIVGFAFSMAVGRYDQRKNYEEEEANAIGTEYVRADLLPAGDADKIHALLKQYLAGPRCIFPDARPRRIGEGRSRSCGVAKPDVVDRRRCGTGTAHAHQCPRHRRNERCAKPAGIYPGGMVEPHSGGRLGVDVRHRYLL